ncbi:hypothetical protein [Paracoccus sp. (in: a-proteobacteria)]|uniref:hypothetical protein n=1 Tax=Paracoccus sp. TaxID=267 RepID=UPI0028AC8A21|nr:hypothetical protein [Paracoccus sp. (in: a-proteobacteria)]
MGYLDKPEILMSPRKGPQRRARHFAPIIAMTLALSVAAVAIALFVAAEPPKQGAVSHGKVSALGVSTAGN